MRDPCLRSMIARLRTDIIERAYQLARSGTCAGIEDVRRQLMADGYLNVSAHLSAAPTLRKDLTRLCLQAQGKYEAVHAGRLRGLRNH